MPSLTLTMVLRPRHLIDKIAILDSHVTRVIANSLKISVFLLSLFEVTVALQWRSGILPSGYAPHCEHPASVALLFGLHLQHPLRSRSPVSPKM